MAIGRRSGRSSTLVWLLGLLVGLVLVSAASSTISLVAIQSVQGTVDTVGQRTVPAIVDVSAARIALVEADRLAFRSFSTPLASRLIGPGMDYQNRIAVASQSLAKLAQDNVAEGADQQLQLVEGLLVTYTGLIEQADADSQVVDPAPAQISSARVALWNAWVLLHKSLFAALDKLERMEGDAFARELSSGWIAPQMIPLWAAPLAALLALLLVAQGFVSRRFRRTLNPPLVVATAAWLVASWLMIGVVGANQHLGAARVALSGAVSNWEDAVSNADFADLTTLPEPCGQASAGCGGDVAAVPVPRSPATTQRQIADAGLGPRGVWAPLISAIVGALAALGLWLRIDQYRYRPR